VLSIVPLDVEEVDDVKMLEGEIMDENDGKLLLKVADTGCVVLVLCKLAEDVKMLDCEMLEENDGGLLLMVANTASVELILCGS